MGVIKSFNNRLFLKIFNAIFIRNIKRYKKSFF